jgi:NAD(P)-dependent dehydrogenase (short-subunit alcohol dehydrogenase family)
VAPSHLLTPAEFDEVNSTNYRGVWLSAREELMRMMKQEPMPTHDGRPGSRGVIVNVASNLALVSRRETRKLIPVGSCFLARNLVFRR